MPHIKTQDFYTQIECYKEKKMKKIIILTYVLLSGLLFNIPINAAELSNNQQLKNCNFATQADWWQQDYQSLPANVANNAVTGEPEFCEFYQFAQDWFLYLISPDSATGLSNWEIQSNYPLLETTGTNSCDKDYPSHSLNVRTAKDPHDNHDFALPQRIDQAGAEAIYDQEGNVVFYEIRFSRNLCDYEKIQEKPNFPGKTVEMKLAWRVLNTTDSATDFYQTNAVIEGKSYKLGLVGWHIVVAADNHPELVWITIDHNNNAVVCDDMGAAKDAYDFTSAACAQDEANCNELNQTQSYSGVKLPSNKQPNDICQVFPYGTVEGDISTNNGLNIALIKKLNNELQNNTLAQSNLPLSLPVWKNYRFTGALWVSDIAQGSNDKTNQRGSLELANAVMETTFQGTPGNADSSLNCFGCHTYNGTDSKITNTPSTPALSHIFDDIISGQQLPEYGSLKNKTNSEYRNNHAKQMQNEYKAPEALFNFINQQDGTYAIKNMKNDKYFQCHIGSMTDKVKDSCQKWTFVKVPDVVNGYYIKNIKNEEYMTRKASKLSNKPGVDEVYLVDIRKH